MLPSNFKNERGASLAEVMVAVGIMGMIVFFASKLLMNSSIASNFLQAKVELRGEMSFVQQRINRFWNTRVNLGEPAPAPQPFAANTSLDRYFTINFRRDASTNSNFDTIDFRTQCATLPKNAQIPKYKFPTECGFTCSVGQIPYVEETFSYNGSTKKRSYPANFISNTENGGRSLIGMAVCAIRSNYDEARVQLIGIRKSISVPGQSELITLESMILTSVKTSPNVELIFKP